MEGSGDGAWSRALMASSGVPIHGANEIRHASAEEREAATEGTTSVRLRELAVFKDPAVREAVARRRDCPFGALVSLAHDRRDDVRVAVASNPSVSGEILEHLIRDKNSSVLCAIARNASVSRDLLAVLAAHRKPEVRRIAERRLAEPGPAAQDDPHNLPPELRDRATVASGPTTTTQGPNAANGRERFHAPRPSVPLQRAPALRPTNSWAPMQ